MAPSAVGEAGPFAFGKMRHLGPQRPQHCRGGWLLQAMELCGPAVGRALHLPAWHCDVRLTWGQAGWWEEQSSLSFAIVSAPCWLCALRQVSPHEL